MPAKKDLFSLNYIFFSSYSVKFIYNTCLDYKLNNITSTDGDFSTGIFLQPADARHRSD